MAPLPAIVPLKNTKSPAFIVVLDVEGKLNLVAIEDVVVDAPEVIKFPVLTSVIKVGEKVLKDTSEEIVAIEKVADTSVGLPASELPT